MIRTFLFAFICFCNSLFTIAQDRSKVSLTLDFARNVEWPKYNDKFKMHVITRDRDLKLAFLSVEKTDQLKGRAIDVNVTAYVVVPDKIDLIFISKQYNSAIPAIINRIGNKPVLVVTEGYEEGRYVMFNLQENSSQPFEYSKANIELQGLQTLGGLAQLGGKEISLKELYQQARDSVRNMELKAPSQEQMVDSLNLNMAIATRLIRIQLDSIDKQKAKIAAGDVQLAKQNNLLDSISEQFNTAKKELSIISDTLSSREEELQQLGGQIAQQQQDALRGKKILDDQIELIALRDEQIKERESSLDEMSTVIDLQRNSLTLLILFAVLLIVFLFFVFRAYKNRKRDARKLAAQRDELQEQKEELATLLLELQQTQSQLVQSEKMASLGVLTAGIAHEINNAINFVYSGINVLDTKFNEILPVVTRVGSLSEEDQNIEAKMKEIFAEKMKVEYDEAQGLIQQMINYVQIGAERTAEIVKGLRSFSRTNVEEKTDCDIHKDLDVALLLLSTKLKDKVKVEKEYEDGLPNVLAFQGQLGQAFLNVINNALDAATERDEDPWIKVSTLTKGEMIEIKIADNGVGMDQAVLDKIFDPFFTTKEVGVGTGLGLSITYGIIEKHGGHVRVNTERGKGSEFTIELPLPTEEELKKAAEV